MVPGNFKDLDLKLMMKENHYLNKNILMLLTDCL